MTMAAIDFQLLAHAGFPPASFAPGETIFAEGDPGDKMYVIRSGEIEVERNGKIVETLSAGGIFGEMALIDAQPLRAPRPPAKSPPSPRRAFCFSCMRRPSLP